MADARDGIEAAITRGERNTYGCLPCPRCGSKYRYPRVIGSQDCDECGHTEPQDDALRAYVAREEE